MWSITLKLMRKTKRMLIPAGIAIMIGTAFIASTFLFGNAMNDSLTRQLTAMFGNANYAVSINSSDLSDKELNEAYSSTVGDFHLDQIAGIEGVGGVRASVETGVSVSKGDSTVSGEIISTAAQKNMLPVNITEGDQPKDSNEVALPEDMAKQLNVGVGDTVSLTSLYAVGDEGGQRARGRTHIRSERRLLILWWCDRRIQQSACRNAGSGRFQRHRNNNGVSRPCLGWKQRIRKNHQRCESVAAKAFRSDVTTANQ